MEAEDRTVLRGMTWSDPRGYEPVVAVAAAFAETRPDVAVVWDKRSLQDFEAFPVDALAATYDLMVIDHPHVGEVAAGGCLVPLDEALPAERIAAFAADSVGPSFESYRWQGHLWALPIDASAPVQAFRPDLLPAPAALWGEVVRHAEAGRVVWPLRSPHALMGFFTLAANRGTPCTTTLGPLIAPGAGRVVLEAMRAAARHIDPACWRLDPIAALDLLAGEDRFSLVPLVYGYRNYAGPGYRRRVARFADMPCLGEAGPRGSCLGGTGLAVSAGTRHREFACAFAAFCADAEVQRTVYAGNGGQAASACAWGDDAVNAAAGGFYRAVRRTVEGAWLRPRHPGYMGFQHAGSEIVADCLAGRRDVGAALEALDAAYRESFRA
jgi:multiple sugar transport system substrate-binding protein